MIEALIGMLVLIAIILVLLRAAIAAGMLELIALLLLIFVPLEGL